MIKLLAAKRRVHFAKGFRTRYKRRKSPREKERVSKAISVVSAVVFLAVFTAYGFYDDPAAMENDKGTVGEKTAVEMVVSEQGKYIGKEKLEMVVSEIKGVKAVNGTAGHEMAGSLSVVDSIKEISDKYLEEISTHSVRVKMEDGSLRDIPIESYVAGVVASEMPSSFHYEALKAQAVAARTYVEAKNRDLAATGAGRHQGASVCTTSCCQVYRDVDGLRSVKSADWMAEDYKKIKNAVADTAGQYLYYDGELVSQPLFFSASGGSTENSEDVFASAVPYLRSVTSSVESVEKYDNRETSFAMADVEAKLTAYISANPQPKAPAAYNAAALPINLSGGDIMVESRTDGGGAALVRFGDILLTGRQVRSLFSLPSADITVKSTVDTVTFITSGNGHRVGLSQYGADAMGKAGSTYKEILSHYYSGTEVK